MCRGLKPPEAGPEARCCLGNRRSRPAGTELRGPHGDAVPGPCVFIIPFGSTAAMRGPRHCSLWAAEPTGAPRGEGPAGGDMRGALGLGHGLSLSDLRGGAPPLPPARDSGFSFQAIGATASAHHRSPSMSPFPISSRV